MKQFKDNPFAIALIAAIFAAGAYAIVFREKFVIADTTKWSEFGDYIGGVLGPAFGLVSIYLLLDTLRLQKQALSEAQAFQQEQLKRDLAALASAHEFQSEQQRSSSRQSFEQTFFSWLHSSRDVVTSVATEGASTTTGRSALKRIWAYWMSVGKICSSIEAEEKERCIDVLLIGATVLSPEITDRLGSAALGAFEEMFESESHNLASMFRSLYRLIKWIDSSNLTATEKHEYVGIVRSQISSIELQFLYFNALSQRGQRFATLINKYAFFDNFESSDRIFSIMRRWDSDRTLGPSAFNADLARSTDCLTAA